MPKPNTNDQAVNDALRRTRLEGRFVVDAAGRLRSALPPAEAEPEPEPVEGDKPTYVSPGKADAGVRGAPPSLDAIALVNQVIRAKANQAPTNPEIVNG